MDFVYYGAPSSWYSLSTNLVTIEVVENIDGGSVALSGREKFDVVLLLSVCHRVMGRWTLKMIGGALWWKKSSPHY